MRSLPNRVLGRLKREFFPGDVGAVIYKIGNARKQWFTCPICNYHGPFYDVHTEVGQTKHEHCPKCGANQRMRLQFLVIEELRMTLQLSKMSMLHFAPEAAFKAYFNKIFLQYISADLTNPTVDYQVDLLDLPFDDHSYDFIFASHVLEHIENDQKALSEIRRVLKPGGIAVLPVPVVGIKTIDYDEPNLQECGHVRAPGVDYFERYAKHFKDVKIFTSSDFPDKYQLYNYEDRTGWPTKEMPLRKAMEGERHRDYVPVCFA